MIKVLETLKAPRLETLICHIDASGRTKKIKIVSKEGEEIVENFRIYKPLTCFSDKGVEYIDIYRKGKGEIIKVIFV